jgi:uncharacterized protein (DUF2267 family)
MPYPQEYQICDQVFYSFLKAVKDEAMFNSTHMTYSMVQGVLNLFRSMLSLEEAILFSNTLPAGVRALFVADWDPTISKLKFSDRKEMINEVQKLREAHNFSFLCEDPILIVAKALRQIVDTEKFETVLDIIGPNAVDFWNTK